METKILKKLSMPEGFEAYDSCKKFGLQIDIYFPDGYEMNLCARNHSEPYHKFLASKPKERAHIAIQRREYLANTP